MNLPILEVKMDRLAECVRTAVMIQDETIRRNVEIAMDQMISDGTLDLAIQHATKEAVLKSMKELPDSWEIREALKQMILSKLS